MAPAATPLDLSPDLEAARKLTEAGANVVPLVHTWVADTETPVSAFLKLRGEGPCFLLESAEQGGRLGRFSFIGVRPHVTYRWVGGEFMEWSGEAALDPAAAPTSTEPVEDPYAGVAERVGAFRLADVEGLPPFPGGAVGLFAYDLVRTVEPLGEPNADPLGLPDLALIVAEAMVVFDHHERRVSLLAKAFIEQDSLEAAYERAAGTAADIRDRLRHPAPPTSSVPRREPEPVADGALPLGFESNLTREQFEANVARIVEYVHAGDAFQVVPSQRFSAPCPVDAFSIYRGLRAVNPSPYMYFLDFGDFQIAGASPEPLVRVTGRRVETRPIAGTYPRGADEEEDRRNAEAMLADPKERAEHVMLVDLGRNDLGRVSEYGSVQVDELMVVETYSHVLHIVSQVSGRLRDGLSAMDVLRSCLPAGTLSGAPKVRAMQIIDELETVKRCSYGGAIGYLGFNGDLDTAIHIRTVVVKDGQAHVQAGGGTVADAKPDYEYRESLQKARAVFSAIELAVSNPEWD
jgi:anthranilate synthase component I